MKPDKKQLSAIMRAIGAKGASAGGNARAAALTPAKRKTIARAAALARWGKRK